MFDWALGSLFRTSGKGRNACQGFVINAIFLTFLNGSANKGGEPKFRGAIKKHLAPEEVLQIYGSPLLKALYHIFKPCQAPILALFLLLRIGLSTARRIRKLTPIRQKFNELLNNFGFCLVSIFSGL